VTDRSSQGHREARWQIRLLALALPVVVLAAIDGVLRTAGVMPPDHPLLFHVETHESDFSPFVERADGTVAIKPDWINPGDGLRGRVGRDPARQFLYPGFRSSRFARHKPDDGIRIFVLGGSTTFGLYVDRQATFAARLEQALENQVDGRRVEVVNLGCAGWASRRVANVLNAILDLDPDLVIVYSGHNEMLEGHLDSLSALSLSQRVRAALLSASSLFAWFDYALTSILWPEQSAQRAEKLAALRAGQIPTFEPRAVPEEERSLPDPGFYDAAASGYAANLRTMIAKTAAAGVPILFVLPVANLLSPPAISAHSEGFDREREFVEAVEAARLAVRAGQLEAGLQHLDRAVALSPRYAMVHYLRALSLQAAGRSEAAQAEYQRALDLDGRTHRITSQLETALIETVEAEGVPWIDLRAGFRSPLDEETAATLFVDHLHPTVLGHQKIADVAMPAVVELLLADRAPLAGP